MKKTNIVSLIGRPNVGKSSLFNKLVGKKNRRNLIFDQPGITRDRHYDIATLDESRAPAQDIILVDTGGFYLEKINEVNPIDHYFNIMAEQAKVSIDESDLVLLVVDVREGLLPFDQQIAQYLERLNKDYWVLINKYDSDKQDGDQYEFYSLSQNEKNIKVVSAEQNLGIPTLRENLQTFSINSQKKSPHSILQQGILPHHEIAGSVSIIGAPNAGKSTLLNCLTQSNRSLVSEVPGTTVDPIEAFMNLSATPNQDPITIRLIDTAGIRRGAKVKGDVEQSSVYRSLRSITDSDVVIAVINATKGITHQDRRLIDIALEKGKSVIICINKIDLLENIKTEKDKNKWLIDQRSNIPWLNFCTICPISAQKNKYIKNLLKAVQETILIRSKKIPTAKLNQCLQKLIIKHPITIRQKVSTHLKIKYASMVKTSPPTIILFTNRSKDIPQTYKRYLQKGIREAFNLDNTPVHLLFRSESSTK